MNDELEEVFLNVAAQLWLKSTEPIRSEVIYAHLREAGLRIPDGAMNSLYRSLMQDNIVGGTLLLNDEAQRTHGGFVITWIDPSYLPGAIPE
ncbi:MAG: hypothetical protein CMR00_12755 [[Chlorobium] sp. 445]|nr:MAG: hypothetical protein CMR00_12755 [[Chlorobium] sp. 445]